MCKHMRRNSYRIRQRKFLLFVIFLFVLSTSIVLMPIGTANKEKSIILLIIAGTLFWIGFIGTLWTTININLSRKASPVFNELYPDLRKFGLIHFFQNKPAIIADIAMFTSIIIIIVVKLLGKSNTWLFVAIALIVFTFGMHCMLNGINYIYVNYRSRREKVS